MKNLKFRSAMFSNRKKQLEVHYTNGKSIVVHYSALSIKKLLKDVSVDKETQGKSLKITFVDGSIDYLPFDQPLFIDKDPEYLLQLDIERIIARIKEALVKKKISKRYLAAKLGTSDNQIQRLLNPSILNKNLSQLYKLADLVGLELEWEVKDVA